MQGRNKRGQEESNSPGAESLWRRRMTAGRRQFPTVSPILLSKQYICFHKTLDSNMEAPCPGCHLTSLRPGIMRDQLQISGTALQGRNEGGKGAQLPGRRIIAGGAENPNSITSAFFNTLHLLPKDLRFEHGGAKVSSCPGRHLTSLRLCCTGSIPETVFWLCKLPKSCVSYSGVAKGGAVRPWRHFMGAALWGMQ